MKALKNLAYTAVAVVGLGLGILAPNYATAQNISNKDAGISFYEHNDLNNNNKVDDGETSKLARIVFEEGENIAIDSKFKSGKGNLYVVSEKGEIVKTISQQYDTGVKTPQLLQNLPAGNYTTVFQQDDTGAQNGSYMEIVKKGESLSKNITRQEIDRLGIRALGRKSYYVGCEAWNDFNGDNIPQRWEVQNPRLALQLEFSEGQSATIISRSNFFPKTIAKLKKKSDKSFQKFEFRKEKTKNKAVSIKTPPLTTGKYVLQIGQYKINLKVNP